MLENNFEHQPINKTLQNDNTKCYFCRHHITSTILQFHFDLIFEYKMAHFYAYLLETWIIISPSVLQNQSTHQPINILVPKVSNDSINQLLCRHHITSTILQFHFDLIFEYKMAHFYAYLLETWIIISPSVLQNQSTHQPINILVPKVSNDSINQLLCRHHITSITLVPFWHEIRYRYKCSLKNINAPANHYNSATLQ